jgi:nucleoside recognition membrane protein YjiH|tara:strand:- start:870 stop:2213 length:1344 start_codon:yes stop_codon:yes gene_type:complete
MKVSYQDLLKFIIPSSIGVLLFLTPIFVDGRATIGMGILVDLLRGATQDYLPAFATMLLLVSCLCSTYFSLFRKNKSNIPINQIQQIFTTSPAWLILRILGSLFAVLVLFNIGPEWISSPATGGTMLFQLAGTLTVFFLVACFLLPFLIDYGVAEFMGTLLQKPFLWAFRLPGRASIDTLASWLGSAPVGVLITIQQYEKGYYSGREAAVIATNFSIASIAFCALVAKLIEIDHRFFEFYFSIMFSGLIAALIIPRIWPLARKKDVYLMEQDGFTDKPEADTGLFRWALLQGINKARTAPNLKQLLKNAFINLLDIWFSLLPSVVAIGTIVLALTEFTPIFTIMTKPLVPILELMQIPEATTAAPAFLVGFADMYLPAVIGKNIASEMTRFVIGCVSIIQIIYMTEVGTLILKSKIPLQIGELFLIFTLRTLITLPIITAIAHFIYR